MLYRISVLLRPFPLLVLSLTLAFSLTACSDKNGLNLEENKEDLESSYQPSSPKLTEVAGEVGLGNFIHENGARGKMYFPELMGSGGGFMDYNGDQWLDILLVAGGSLESDDRDYPSALRLYENMKDGSFSEVTAKAGLSKVKAYGQGISVADVDGDGDEDIFLTTIGKNYLFQNDDGFFTSIGEKAGLAGNIEWSSSALFFDADNDADLDLYVGNYVDWSPEKDIFCSIQGVVIIDTRGAKNLDEQYGQKVYCAPGEFEGKTGRFYRNQGDGTFIDETAQAGFLPSPGKSLGVADIDYNRDGWSDLYVANDGQADLLYKNKGNGTFSEVGLSSGIAFDETGRARAGMGVTSGVVDDGPNETIFVGNFSSEQIGVYQNQGNDLFKIRGNESKIGQPSFLTLTFGLLLLDIEHDGDLDLLAANGHVWSVRPTFDGSTFKQKTQLFLNEGNGTFDLASSAVGNVLDKEMVARGASYGDYDRDGDLDILITENGGTVHLWRNDLEETNYLRVHLKGRNSNLEGLGSNITVVIGERRMHRRIATGSSYLSQSEKVASFGLRNHTKVDSLIVDWPSGQRDVFLDLEGRQSIAVMEGDPLFEKLVISSSSSESK